MSELRFIISAALLALGVAAVIISIAGVFKFRFVMNRMHSAAIIDAFAVLLIICGLAVASGGAAYIPKLLLVLLFLWVGSPIASHMVGRLEISTDESAEEYMERKEGLSEAKAGKKEDE